jgi:pyruvate,water dikinase
MEAAPPGFRQGFAEAFERFGLPFRSFEIADVDGWFFGTFAPVSEEDLPGRVAAAERALDVRPWRAIADEWTTSIRGPLLQRNRDLQAIEPRALDDRALAAHLAATLELLQGGLARHFLHAGAHWVGVGLLVDEAITLPGWPAERVVRALAGGSPTSIAPVGGLRRIADAVAADPRASAILAGDGEPRAVLAELRAASRSVAKALDDYLDDHGWQVFTGFDFTHEAMIELPALLLATVRSVAEPSRRDGDEADRLREAVAPGDRARLEVLLDDALATYGLRDDDSGITVQRPLGLVRRAVLEAGRRLAARGALHDRDDAFDATAAELVRLLTGESDGPSADELARRAARRRPPFPVPPRRLGDDQPPPDETLPPAMARLVGALFSALALEDTGETEQRVAGPLRGAGASPGIYEGRARLIRGPEDFERLGPGDVLVAAITTPAYNVVLPLLGAVVTDRGGVLSHPAIVAREFGIPAVVGTGSATATIPDGTRVRVDGTLGTVSILGG